MDAQPLQRRFPRPLPERWALGSFPTPVRYVEDLDLWVKCEDLSGSLYGGNKVRKLEYLLPEAARRGGDLLSVGATGSHHLLACATYGRQRGVRVHAFTIPQPISEHVTQNNTLLRERATTVTACGGEIELAWRVARKLLETRGLFVWAGGSTPLGTLGWVQGGLEIGEQVARGELPEPVSLWVALGSGGTAAGLLLGLQLAGLRTRVHAVRVADALFANRRVVGWLATRAAQRLGVPAPDLSQLIVHHDFIGRGYGHSSPQGQSALIQGAACGLLLEDTYTSKTLAACLALRGEGPALFLNSLSSVRPA